MIERTTPANSRLGLARERRNRKLRIVAALALASTTLAAAGPSVSAAREHHHLHGADDNRPADTFVTSWDAIGTQAFSAAALTPAEGHVIFAYVAIAVYDSMIAVEGGYEPFAIAIHAPMHASSEAAVAAAAHRILVHYLPAQAATIINPAFTASLATLPDGQSKTDGVATGERVADLLIAMRAGDGFRAAVTYTPPNPPIPGVWIPTGASPPIGPYLALMHPFSLDSADQFRPDGPPALHSIKWAREYNEVKELGSATSTTRTAEQTVAARFWAEAPVQQAHASLRKFVLDRQLDVVEAARFMAMSSVTFADALIACFDAKYHYPFWRPITAIRAGDTDGNHRTEGDPAWSPLLPGTPNHPEYPSAHSCITPAVGRIMAGFLGTRQIDLTVPSLTGLGDRHFETVRDLEYEVSYARIWGGIHYRSAIEDGAVIGKRVARQVINNHFHESDGENDD